MIDETGSVLPLTAVMLAALLGMTALVLDVGSWYRADRALQAAADAAALAGAAELPDETQAKAVAVAYAAKNGATAGVSVEVTENGVEVDAQRKAPGFFSRVFGIDEVDVAAQATARANVPVSVRGAVPIAVSEDNAMLACRCFGVTTTIERADVDAGGNFGFVDIGDNGSNATGIVASLMETGYTGYLSPGWVGVFPGNRWSAGPVRSALEGREGDEIVLPVYRTVTGSGNGAQYEIVAFAAFQLDQVNGDELTGRFVRLNVDGTGEAPATQANLGVTTYTRLVG